MKLSSVILLLLFANEAACHVINYGTHLPPHVIEKYGIRDPKKHRKTGIHDIPLEDIYKRPKRNVHRKKEHHEIPRVKEEHYHSEEILHHEHHYDPAHMDEARVHHYKDIRKR